MPWQVALAVDFVISGRSFLWSLYANLTLSTWPKGEFFLLSEELVYSFRELEVDPFSSARTKPDSSPVGVGNEGFQPSLCCFCFKLGAKSRDFNHFPPFCLEFGARNCSSRNKEIPREPKGGASAVPTFKTRCLASHVSLVSLLWFEGLCLWVGVPNLGVRNEIVEQE